MYLLLLKQEQKISFLELAYRLAMADGCYSDSEKAVMDCYCAEMGVGFDPQTMVRSADEIIEEMSTYGEREKKIIVFEAIGLAMADADYDQMERNMVKGMAEKFRLDPNFSQQCEEVLNEYLTVQNRINAIVVN